jgi:hypothetical protein
VVATAALHASPVLAQEAAAAPDASEPNARQACLGNHEQAQVLRIEKKLVAARNAARECAVTACPAAIRSDCTEWVAEISKLIPTLLLVAESGSGELENVRVTLDGKLLTEKLHGAAFEVEPGPHVLRFEYENEPPIERLVTAAEGEKSLMVRVRFASEPAPPTGPPVPIAPRMDSRPHEPGERPIPLLTYVFGGVAIVAGGTSAVVAAGAFSERNAAREECAPTCDAERIDSIRNRFRAADALGGVAIASAGLAAVFYFTRPEIPKDRSSVGIAPFWRIAKRDSGVELAAGGRF